MVFLTNSSCNKCSKPANLMCQRCHEAYCSADCQILDWKEHKSKCHQMPNLVPMGKVQPNGSSSSDVQTQQLHHYRSLARNPLPPIKKYDAEFKPLLEDNDFAFKPKVIEHSDGGGASAKGAIPKKLPMISTSAELAWRTAFSPPQGKFFDVFIQWIEKDRRFLWVTEVKYDSPLRKLLVEINRNVKIETTCSVEEIKSGALVAAPLDDIFYRAEVLEANNSAMLATVRLIDYGNELQLSYHQLRSSMPIMRNLNAYAIRVCLPEHQVKHDLHVESIISIRILTTNTDLNMSSDTIYYVQLKSKSIPLNLPLSVLADNPEMLLRKVFIGGQKALLQYSAFSEFDTEMNQALTADSNNLFDIDQMPEEGAFLAAHTSDGWRRSCCLGYWAENKTYLVYLIDEARVEMCKEVKKIPHDFLSHSMRIVAVTLTSTQDLLDESKLSTEKLTLHPLTYKDVSADMQSLPCVLYANKQKISDVLATTFVGILNDFDVKCWPETIEDGTLVYITHVISHSDIFITSSTCSAYPTVFTSMAASCSPYILNEELIKDEIVLATLTENDTYFRAKILTACSGTAMNIELKVLDIDTGRCCNVLRSSIRKPNLFVRSCPVYVKKVKLIYIDRIPSPFENNKAISTLHHCKENRVEFTIKHEVGNPNTVDLRLKTDDKQSLSKQLLPLLFEESSILNEPNNTNGFASETNVSAVAEETLLPPSPPNSPKEEISPVALQKELPKCSSTEQEANLLPLPITNLRISGAAAKIYTSIDLKIIPISEGENVELLVLDASTIGKGCITASDFGNKASAKQLEPKLDRVKEYGKASHLQKDYKPKTDEVCLTLFEDDGEWYRALCVKPLEDGTFLILFLDYGNMCIVTKDNILPITKELMFPSNANLCVVENLPSNLTKLQQIAFINATISNPVVQCKVQRQIDDTYKITILDIEKYFA